MGCPLHGDACRAQVAPDTNTLEVTTAAPQPIQPSQPVDVQIVGGRSSDEEIEIAQMQGEILAKLGAE